MKPNSLPETNIFAPENWWLEDEFPFGMAYIFFQVPTVTFKVLGSVDF